MEGLESGKADSAQCGPGPDGAANSRKAAKVMKDEFELRDIKFDQCKAIYKNELGGPTLARMEANKRVAIAQHLWKITEESYPPSKAEQLINAIAHREQEQESDQYLQLLDLNYRSKFIQQMDVDDMEFETIQLNKRFDQIDYYSNKYKDQYYSQDFRPFATNNSDRSRAHQNKVTKISPYFNYLEAGGSASSHKAPGHLPPGAAFGKNIDSVIEGVHSSSGNNSNSAVNQNQTFSAKFKSAQIAGTPAKSPPHPQHPDFYQLISKISGQATRAAQPGLGNSTLYNQSTSYMASFHSEPVFQGGPSEAKPLGRTSKLSQAIKMLNL